jgi:hypothetical protein
MKLLLYTTASQRVAERAKTILGPSVPEGEVEIYRTINEFSRRLRQPKDDLTIVVLLLASREDVLDLLAISHLFRNVRIVLVVPDLEDETIALAHRLRPRFLSYIDGNFQGLATVVSRMSAAYI